jgi:hypothetical protein
VRTRLCCHRTPIAIIALATLLAAALPDSVRAYEDQLSLGVGAGYAYATLAGSSHHGAWVNLEASLGLSSTWSVRALLGYGEHPAAARLSRGLIGAEVLYLVDVLEFVPYAGVGVDALASFTTADTQLAVGTHPVVGIDWLLGRSFLLGLCVRPFFVLSELDRSPLYLTSSLTAAWLLDL